MTFEFGRDLGTMLQVLFCTPLNKTFVYHLLRQRPCSLASAKSLWNIVAKKEIPRVGLDGEITP